MLIAFEGIEGSGKTTHAAMLASMFKHQEREVVLSEEPTRSPWGRQLKQAARMRRLPLDVELDTALKDRQSHVQMVINPSLERGAVVIVDRYYYTNVASHAASGADPKAILEKNAFAPKPHLVFLLDLEPSAAQARFPRRAAASDAQQKLEEQTRMRAVYRELARTEGNFVVVDCTQELGAVQEQIRNAVKLRSQQR